jgi:hypothetical protein
MFKHNFKTNTGVPVTVRCRMAVLWKSKLIYFSGDVLLTTSPFRGNVLIPSAITINNAGEVIEFVNTV